MIALVAENRRPAAAPSSICQECQAVKSFLQAMQLKLSVIVINWRFPQLCLARGAYYAIFCVRTAPNYSKDLLGGHGVIFSPSFHLTFDESAM
jgi:hypothetical protein